MNKSWVGMLMLGCAVALCPLRASALLVPKPLATDARIRDVVYNPNQVYKFIGHYGYQSSIEFAADEEIQTVSIGDSLAWKITPAVSRLFLKPVLQDALTNLSVITNKRTYHFELHPEETDNIEDKDMVFVLRFIYNNDESDVIAGANDAVPDLSDPEERAKLNFNYTVSGNDDISPMRVFDDGEFTFFQFKNKNADVPAFFLVDAEGFESLINFRTRGDYIVVERVASQLTLRHGKQVACVYNESRPLARGGKRSVPGQQQAPVPPPSAYPAR